MSEDAFHFESKRPEQIEFKRGALVQPKESVVDVHNFLDPSKKYVVCGYDEGSDSRYVPGQYMLAEEAVLNWPGLQILLNDLTNGPQEVQQYITTTLGKAVFFIDEKDMLNHFDTVS